MVSLILKQSKQYFMEMLLATSGNLIQRELYKTLYGIQAKHIEKLIMINFAYQGHHVIGVHDMKIYFLVYYTRFCINTLYIQSFNIAFDSFLP